MAGGFPRIVCTLGTTTDDPHVLAGLIAAGMGMARINTAYASFAEMGQRIDLMRAAGPTPVMLDLKGPQLRVICTTDKIDPATGEKKVGPCRYPVVKGELIRVCFGEGPVRFNHDFEEDAEVGDPVTFDNGTIRARVVEPAAEGIAPERGSLLLRVLEAGSGHLSPQVGANVPGKRLSVPSVSERDREAITLGMEKHVEWYALSFVRDADDLAELQQVLAERGESEAGLIAKIEDQCGIDSLERIAEEAKRIGRPFAVMVARGDLFVEFPPVQLPRIQADLVRRCRALGVPCIVATGLLLSMQQGTGPSRSEVSDVAAALAQGADSLMLSDETSNGKDPVAAAQMLAALIEEYGTRA